MVTLAKGKQNVSACIFDVVMSCACALEPRIYNDCGNWSGPSTGLDPLSFFRIPADTNQREKWIADINRSKWTPTEYTRICCDHFITGMF